MRRFVKALSGMLAVVLLFSALPQATAAPELESENDIGTVSEETPTDAVYDLIISKSRLYLLPGTSYRLTVISVAEPTDPQPELAVEPATAAEEAAELPFTEELTEVTAATETTAAEEMATELSTQPAEESTVPGESNFVDDDPVMMPTEPETSTEVITTEPETATEATTTEPETSTEAATTEPQPEETTAESTTAPELSEIERPTETITPIPADDNGLYVWRSNDEAVATVSPDGVVTAVSLGMAVVTASTADGSCTAVCEVMVVDKMPDGNKANNSVMATNYATPHTAITTDWVNQYNDPDDETAVRTISPGTMLKLIRKEGNFYVAHTLDSTANYYMWAPNIFDRHGGSGYIEICRQNTTDTRRHWDMYTSQSLTLAVKTGGTATWTSSNANIATVSSSGAITPKAAGTTYITANQNGKKDVIHLTVITKYSSVKTGVVKESWCSKYRCSHSNCTVYGRKEGDSKPYKVVRIYGESAGFYYANVVEENSYIYMWKSNLALENWYQHCTLNNLDSDGNMEYKPQGLAVDSRYCYSFQIGRYDESIHQLYRYDMNTGAKLLMTPVRNDQGQLPGTLLHANDAAIAYFTEDREKVPYLFVAALGSPSYIVKLGFTESGEYREVGRYLVNNGQIRVAGITTISERGANPAVFLINYGSSYYRVSISDSLDSVANVTAEHAFGITIDTVYDSKEKVERELVPQGIHYEPSTDRLYLAFSSPISSKEGIVYAYKNIKNAVGTPASAGSMSIVRSYGDRSFELEALAFRPNSTDKRLWFSTFEGNVVAAGIYTDPKEIRYMEGNIS